MSTKTEKLSLETGMLSFARSVQTTEGFFYATQSEKPEIMTPIEVFEKGVRGQSSEDRAKNPGKSNPQSVECAVVPQGHDGVRIRFSVRFMPCSLSPHACGDTDVGNAYRRLTNGYRAAGGYSVLAHLYVWNLANARFAWRNRFQSDAMTVTLTFCGQSIAFDPFRLSLEVLPTRDEMLAAITVGDSETFDALIDGVAKGLSSAEAKAFTVKVSWDAQMEPGQEVFPSQEYLRTALSDERKKEDSKEYGKPLKVLAKMPVYFNGREIMQASLHSQKSGAAIRHIDIWHGDDSHAAPIAVNPYGGVQETGAVLRDPKSKKSFYDLRACAADLIAEVEAAVTSDEIGDAAHFVMANLVRGGVFGASTKKTEVK